MKGHVCIGVEGEASFTMRSGDKHEKVAWLSIDPFGTIIMTTFAPKEDKWPKAQEVQPQDVPRVLREALEFLGEDYSWLDSQGNPEVPTSLVNLEHALKGARIVFWTCPDHPKGTVAWAADHSEAKCGECGRTNAQA
jgi:hypothetical protein